DFRYEFYGLFGIIIFIGILAYLIVKYQAFNIKLIASQALVATLVILVGSQLLFVRNPINLVLTGITFLFVFIFGYFLVKSEQREKIEKLAKDLELANKHQTELIHFITHQIKGFLTKTRNIFSMIKEGSYGTVPENILPLIEEGFSSDTKAVNMVQDTLKAAD